jgi:ATP-dependent exoDNAse (exonuclease V) beta subunit
MSKLIVYRASAGSGKTFRLAAEYIKQLISKPDSYRNILAVTFTNKATAEMKGRILNELFAISQGDLTPMQKQIAEELGIANGTIQVRAQKALTFILHDYSRFSISTIDSFVQRVIQALLWEIGEQGGVDIELDTAPVLEHAADNLLDSAAKFDDLLHWLTSMGHSLMDEGNSWDVRRKLMELGKQLFTEKFRLMSQEDIQKFSDKEKILALKELLQVLIKDVVIDLNSTANAAFEQLEKRGIEPNTFLHGSKGVMGFFSKCSNIDMSTDELPTYAARVLDAYTDPTGESWVTKAMFSNKVVFEPYESAVKEVLHPSLCSLIEILSKRNAHFISAKLVLKNLENLALIGDLWSEVRDLSHSEGFLLLSDSGHLLREFVKETDAPFVYEKVGTRYDVFMIDEFQDTSEVQWHNFKPLIENSLAQDKFSMIVGDVKQSIYRWRNGDWSILASGVDNDFKFFGTEKISLDTNRRSLPAIVDFNNRFFEKARDIAKESIGKDLLEAKNLDTNKLLIQVENAYRDIQQISNVTQDTQNGYVEVRFCKKEDNTDFAEQLSTELPQLILNILANHNLADIAILVRGKSDGQQVANILLEHNRKEPQKKNHIAFVSQEGLKLNSSSVVRLLIAAFRIVHDSANEIAKRILAKEMLTLKEVTLPNWHNSFQASNLTEEVEWLGSLNTRPLQEVFEAIASKYNLFEVKGELAYLAELHEHIATIGSKGGGDVNRFLSWWEQKGEAMALSVPDSANALSIITIHKSKGLQFPVVIIPYANWPFRPSGKQPLLWVQIDQEPFNILPKYPINISKSASQSLFAEDIFEENMKEFVDNINMLYVAFTRPQKELYIFVPLSKSEIEKKVDNVNSASKLIRSIVPELHKDIQSLEEDEVYKFGEPFKKILKQGLASDNSKDSNWIIDSYPVGQTFQGVKLRLEAEDFFSSTPTQGSDTLKYGKVMHELFSNIRTIDDVDKAIQKLVVDGLVESREFSSLSKRVNEIIRIQPFIDWFSGNWDIKTEETIVTPEGYNYRPDRVMIKGEKVIVVDFKFGAEKPNHQKQVLSYMKLLERMGYRSVKGFIWYVDDNIMLEVGEPLDSKDQC